MSGNNEKGTVAVRQQEIQSSTRLQAAPAPAPAPASVVANTSRTAADAPQNAVAEVTQMIGQMAVSNAAAQEYKAQKRKAGDPVEGSGSSRKKRKRRSMCP